MLTPSAMTNRTICKSVMLTRKHALSSRRIWVISPILGGLQSRDPHLSVLIPCLCGHSNSVEKTRCCGPFISSHENHGGGIHATAVFPKYLATMPMSCMLIFLSLFRSHLKIHLACIGGPYSAPKLAATTPMSDMFTFPS